VSDLSGTARVARVARRRKGYGMLASGNGPCRTLEPSIVGQG